MNPHDRRTHLSRASASARLMSLIAMAAMIASLVAGMIAPPGPASAQADYAAESQGELLQQNPIPIPTFPPVQPIPPYPPIPTYPPVLPIPTYPSIPTYPPMPTEQPVQPTATYPPKPTELPVDPTPTYPPKPTELPVDPTPTYPPKPTEQSADPTYPPKPTEQPVQPTPTDPLKTGTVYIYKYTCPPEIERTSDHETLRDTCLESIKPVEFTVKGPDYARTQLAEGYVPLKTAFTDVPFGAIAIIETVPDGYGEPIAFCGDGSDFTEVSVSGDTVRWTLDSGSDASTTCLFFNVVKEEAPPTVPSGERATTFTFIFTKYYCPELNTWDRSLFIPPGTGGPYYLYDALVETCREPLGPPATLVLTNDGGFSRRVVVDEPVPGSSSAPIAYQAVAEDLPVNRDLPITGISIKEVTPAGYGSPYIGCYGDLWDPSPYFAGRNVSEEGVLVNVRDDEGDDDLVVYCDIFNVPSAGQETVTVTKYTCPPDSARTDDRSALVSGCTSPAPPGASPSGFAFTLKDSLGQPRGWYIGDTSGPVNKEFTDIAGGPITITEPALEGYGEPFVFCSADPDGGVPFERVPVTVTGSADWHAYAVSWDLDTDDSGDLECQFFNIPEDGAPPPTASMTKEGDGKDNADRDVPKDDGDATTVELVFEKRYCPRRPSLGRLRQLDVDGTPAPPAQNAETIADDLASQCDRTGDPVQVEVSQGPDPDFDFDLLTDSNEIVVNVRWHRLIRIVELTPSGYGSFWMVCRSSNGWLLVEEGYAWRRVEGLAIYMVVTSLSDTLEAESDAEKRCTLYNVPLEDKPDVTVTKYTCPDDVARSDNYFQLAFACQVSVDPVEFTLTDTFGGTRTQHGEDIVWAQQAVFETVPLGPVTITETVPEGYGEPVAFCTYRHSDLPFERMTVTDGTVSWELDPDDTDGQGCLFFNFSLQNTATVNVSKYTCRDYVRRATVVNLMGTLMLRCRKTAAPVTFTLTDQASGEEFVQRAEGTVPLEAMFADVAYGDFTLSEALPARYGEPYVFCSDTVVDGRNTDYQKMFPAGGSISWRLDPAAAGPFHCIFFNVPERIGDSVPDAMNAILPPPLGGKQTRAFIRRPKNAPNRKRPYQA